MAVEQTSGSQLTYTLMFSLFLKMLGFFVVLYSFTEFQPNKLKAAEQSLQQQFNISLPLDTMLSKSGKNIVSPWALQSAGRSYDEIAEELKTQIDFLSVKNDQRGALHTKAGGFQSGLHGGGISVYRIDGKKV